MPTNILKDLKEEKPRNILKEFEEFVPISHRLKLLPEQIPQEGIRKFGPIAYTLASMRQRAIQADIERKLALPYGKLVTEPGMEEPWIPNPFEMIFGIGAAARKMGMTVGQSFLSGILGAGAEYPIGMATEEIEKYRPRLALPFNIATGIVSGMTAEKAIERGIIKVIGKRIPLEGQKIKTKLLQLEFRKRFAITKPTALADIKSPAGENLYSGVSILTQVRDLYNVAIGTPGWDNIVMIKLPKTLERVPGGKQINRALLYDYRGNLPNTPGYLRNYENMQRYQRLGKEYAIDLGRRLQDMPENSQLRMGEYIRGELDVLSGKELELANEAKRTLYDLGKQAVDLEMLKEETFFRHAGRYMPRLYTSKEYNGMLIRYGLKKPTRLDLSRFKKRKDIPKAIRQEMGEILTPGYPVAKGIAQLTHDIEMMKFFKGIANNPEWAWTTKLETTIPEGFKQLPDTRKLGPLSKAYVHPEIHADLNETIRMMGTVEKTWRKLLGLWKVGKIVNPKTMARNLFGGNVILSHLGGFPMWRQPRAYLKALKDIRTMGQYYIGARSEGLMRTTWSAGELKQLFEAESEMIGFLTGKLPNDMTLVTKAMTRIQAIAQKGGRLYQKLEEWSKLAHYIDCIENRGMTSKQAAAEAQKWLFDYSRVTKFQEKYRSGYLGAPFATFPFKALPRIAEAIIKTPWRFALPMGFIYGIEKTAQIMIGDSPEKIKAKKELRPSWQKGRSLGLPNFARFPLVDDYGREYYWNTTYWLPWGDIGEAGGFMGIPGALVPLSQPFIKETFQQIVNYDAFWEEQIVKEEDWAGVEEYRGIKTGIAKFLTKTEIRAKHLGQSLAPTIAIDVIKGVQAIRGKPDIRGRFRHPLAVGLDIFAGIKLYPVHYAEQMMKEITKSDPRKGFIANKIQMQIETYSIMRNAIAQRGGNTDYFDKQIAKKIKQLQGIARELETKGKKVGPAFIKKPEKKPINILRQE